MTVDFSLLFLKSLFFQFHKCTCLAGSIKRSKCGLVSRKGQIHGPKQGNLHASGNITGLLFITNNLLPISICDMIKMVITNNLGGDPVIKVWDQEVCFLCGLRFEPCGCSYDGHWRLTWSLTS